MVYAYRCGGCGHQFDVIKPAADMERAESCDRCQRAATREFVPRIVHLSKTKVQHAEFNPGLGCIVNNAYHRSELCKEKGLEEIGNEKPESLHKHFQQKRAEMREEAWAKVDDGLDPRIEAQVMEDLKKQGGISGVDSGLASPEEIL